MIRKLSFVAFLAGIATTVALRAEDPEPELARIRVIASDPVAFRGLSSGAFTIFREDTNGALSVTIALSGTASNGVDYVTLPGSVTIPSGFHAVGLEVEPLGEGDASPNEVVILTLVTNSEYRLGRSARASVLIKGNEFENQAPVVEITSPADNSGLIARSDLTITADATDPNDAIRRVSFFVNDHFLGSDTEPPYSLVWSNVPAGRHALFARAQDEFGKSTLSAAVNIVATNPPTGGGVVLTSPTNRAVFGAPANIPLSARLRDTNAVPQSIAYFEDDNLIGTATNAPFSLIWSNVPPGEYTLRAVATETNGAVSRSSRVRIEVINLPPTVTFLTPTNNTVIPGPTNVLIEVEATDSDGINGVMFFGGQRFLGTVRTAPYSITWSNVPPGDHRIFARAIDSLGEAKTASVEITISNSLPTVTLIAPTNGTTFPARATFELQAQAADPDGIDHVSFWDGRRRLGEDRTAPYTFLVRNADGGTHTYTARAVDRFGQRTTSEPVEVTVERSRRDRDRDDDDDDDDDD